MQQLIHYRWRGLLMALCVGGFAVHATAADVRVGISTKETYVGMPVQVQIQVYNASDTSPPVFPQVDGLAVHSHGSPSQSTQITTINGVTTKNSSLTYVYEVTPQRVGSFRIPPITVEVDGKKQQTRPIDFVASKSETGDLLFVEVAGKEKEIYVGQALDLTLKVCLRPFRDADRNLTLSAGDMWKMISPRSSWGVFEDRMAQLASNRERPHAQEVLRKDPDGAEHSYYLYEIDATIYPKSPGRINAEDVHVIVEYPTALGTSRDPFDSMFSDMMPRGFASPFGRDDFASPFGPRLTVQSARPLVADATVEPIDVLSIPTIGRPQDYRGAVGNYEIVTEARQTSVKAGDPIELLIGVVGTGPMELVQAPPLAELPELTADFKVPNEPLAGFVQGDRKVFSTTIRPRKAGIAEIPGIPFTFFDPQQEQFVTVCSNPISIHVDPADTLALDAIVHSRAASGHGADQANAATALVPSYQNYTSDQLLRSESPHRLISGTTALMLALPPLVVGGIWLGRNRHAIAPLLSRFGFGTHRAEARIQESQTIDELSRTLESYLARRMGLKSGINDTSTIIGALRGMGQHNLAVRCERIFHAARQPQASGVSHPISISDAKHEALEVIEELQRHHDQKRTMPTRKPKSTRNATRVSRRASRVASAIVGATLLAGGSSAAQASLEASQTTSLLTSEQQQAVLADANQAYENAMNLTGEDSAEAKQGFDNAAEKYQMLINSGISNSRLYVNLANAYLQSGQTGKAIANYHRALKIDPGNTTAQVNLQYAQQSIDSSHTEGTSNTDLVVGDLISTANRWFIQRAGLKSLGAVAIAGWLVVWLTIGLRTNGIRFPWKSMAGCAAVVAIASASLYVANWEHTDQTLAIVTAPSVALREGDGENFPTAGASLSEGESVEVLKWRGGWFKVRLPSDETGWITGACAELI